MSSINSTEQILANIDAIKISKRMRTLNPVLVKELASSIRDIGLLCPVIVAPDDRLIAGWHRVEACKQLGWAQIPAIVKDYDAMREELCAIDENLLRNNLTALEEAEHLADRHSIYIALHPATRRGVAGANARHGAANEILSFAADTAAMTGQSPRNIQRKISLADHLSSEIKELIRDTPIADSFAELERLDAHRNGITGQKEIAEMVRAGKAKDVREAVSKLRTNQSLPLNDRDKFERAKQAGQRAALCLGKLEKAINELKPEAKLEIRDFVRALSSNCEAILSIVDRDLEVASLKIAA